MIINNNEIVLYDSELAMTRTLVAIHTTNTETKSHSHVKVTVQIGFFLSADLMFESPRNAVRVVGFEGNKYLLEFEYPINDEHMQYYYDLQVKAYLMTLYPEWDETKLLLTTTPPEN